MEDDSLCILDDLGHIGQKRSSSNGDSTPIAGSIGLSLAEHAKLVAHL